jgi:hypothetical protein
MAKRKAPKKKRSFDAMNALHRKAGPMKDRRTPRKQSNNWKNLLEDK